MYRGEIRESLAHAQAERVRGWVDDPRAGQALYDRLCFADVQGYLPEDLMTKMDLASMAHGLETRSPLLDHRVLELAASVPAELRCPNGRLKGLLKDAFREAFPADLLERPKRGFAPPIQDWFRGPWLGLARDLLLARDAHLHGYLEPGFLGALVEEHASGRAHRGFQLWALVMLELWHREVATG